MIREAGDIVRIADAERALDVNRTTAAKQLSRWSGQAGYAVSTLPPTGDSLALVCSRELDLGGACMIERPREAGMFHCPSVCQQLGEISKVPKGS